MYGDTPYGMAPYGMPADTGDITPTTPTPPAAARFLLMGLLRSLLLVIFYYG